MRSGLEVFLDERAAELSDARVGIVTNHTAIDHHYEHAIDRLMAAGVNLVRLFGPEHGVRATAQDMEGVDEVRDPVTNLPVISLYGDDEASLHPDPATLEDLDVVLFDIQDIGARYYTYQATLGFVMAVAGRVGTKVIVLDRPNPIDGVTVEGNLVGEGFESFVGAYPIAQRHGMTVGELSAYFQKYCGVQCETEVVPCKGWSRDLWFDETDLPWVYPSPNMPTLECATIYPGMCLFEATTLSEGRGTTRPFHLFGAPGLDPDRLVRLCREGARKAGLKGVAFRPAAFIPGFQKHTKAGCTGAEVHLTDRSQLNATLLGLVTLQAAYRCDPDGFGWRPEPYEFVADVPAIDLLTGSTEVREAIEADRDVHEVLVDWEAERLQFVERRENCLIY